MIWPVNTRKPAPHSRSSVRIIGGSWRGRRVEFPELAGLRPTPDRVRETLFNWLQSDIPGARCLDLFAGSGALGLEALSRGAAECVFVEQAPAAARTVRELIRQFGGGARGRVVEMGAARFLRTPGGEAFHVLFLDPPFGQGALAAHLTLIVAGGWVRSGSLVYLENERAAGTPALPAGWELLKSKSAGQVGYHLARVNVRSVE
jgi:16S rRNA (guanine966-N2)-methyltransferase